MLSPNDWKMIARFEFDDKFNCYQANESKLFICAKKIFVLKTQNFKSFKKICSYFVKSDCVFLMTYVKYSQDGKHPQLSLENLSSAAFAQVSEELLQI